VTSIGTIDRVLPTEPLVLHVIPTPVARGAQREARGLADQLDTPGVRAHRVLCLFDGPNEVRTDISLAFDGGLRPASGFDPRLVPQIRRALRQYKPEVVVAHGSDALKYLVPAMIGQPSRLIYYAIGVYAGDPTRRLQVALWRFLSSRADLVGACGREVYDEGIQLLKVRPNRLVLLSNGRDPALFHPREQLGEMSIPVVAFVGALTVTKRPDRFVEVVSKLREGSSPFRAILIGEGPLRESLEGPASAAGVELLGSRADVPQLLRESDVFIFPSLPAGEGMPGVLIEAGLSGLPVVATAVPGVNTIVANGRTGQIVDVEDLAGMVTATSALLKDPERRSIMGRAARDRCETRFSLMAVAEGWQEALRPLLRSSDPL
jgi:glycosyltransferase involved in cell wall biosynthesis